MVENMCAATQAQYPYEGIAVYTPSDRSTQSDEEPGMQIDARYVQPGDRIHRGAYWTTVNKASAAGQEERVLLEFWGGWEWFEPDQKIRADGIDDADLVLRMLSS